MLLLTCAELPCQQKSGYLLKESYCLHKWEQRFLVFMPGKGQFLFRGKSITSHIHSHLKAVGVEIVEVLHSWPQKNKNPKKHTHRFITGLTAPSSRLSRQQHFPSWLRNLFYFSGFVPPPPKLTACQAGPLSCINDPFLTLSTRRSTACVFIGHGFVGICISCCDKFENLQNVKLVNCFSLCSDEKITTDLNHMFTGIYRGNKHK